MENSIFVFLLAFRISQSMQTLSMKWLDLVLKSNPPISTEIWCLDNQGCVSVKIPNDPWKPF